MSEANPPQNPPKRRSVLRFLFATTLGCLSFGVGSLVVLVLLVPTMLSGPVSRWTADQFGAQHQGSLRIGEVSLGWFQRQELRDAELLDPDGRAVARVWASCPSILDLLGAGDGAIGEVRVRVEADLVADDAGATNLDRALEPRRPAPPEADPRRVDAEPYADLERLLERLALDLHIDAPRITWSDVRTRAARRSYELRDLVLTVQARPGQPYVFKLRGHIAGEPAGVLEVDATCDGPIRLEQRWPAGRTRATARIERFSAGLIDGLAGLQGALVDAVGDEFGANLRAEIASLDAGTIDLDVRGARGSVSLAARMEGGAVTATERPFLLAELPLPRRALERALAGRLPPETGVAFADAGAPWSVRVPRLRVALPQAGAWDLAALAPILDAAEFELEAALPCRVTLDSAELRAAGVSASASALKVRLWSQAEKPFTARLDADLAAGEPGSAQITVAARRPFASLAAGGLPAVDVDASIDGLSTHALGEIAGQGARFAQALGPRLALTAEARGAHLGGGRVALALRAERANVEAGGEIRDGVLELGGERPTRIAWRPDPAFLAREIAPFVPEGAALAIEPGSVEVDVARARILLPDAAKPDVSLLSALEGALSVSLPAVRWSDAHTAAAGLATGLDEPRIVLAVAPDKGVEADVTARVVCGTATPAALKLTARTRGTLDALMAEPRPDVDTRLEVQGLDTSALERLAGQEGRISALLGPKLGIVVQTTGALPDAGSIDARIAGDEGSVALRGSIAAGRFTAAGDAGFDATARLSTEFLRARAQGSLPEGARIEVAGGGAPVTLRVRDLVLPLDFADVPALLAATELGLEAELPAIEYVDPRTAAAGRTVELSGGRLTARLSAAEPAVLRFTARVDDTPPGGVEFDLRALDPLATLMEEGGIDRFRAAVRLRAQALPTALLDVLAAQEGLLVDALGARLEMEFDAPQVSRNAGAFAGKLTSDKHSVRCAGRLDAGSLRIDQVDGLDARLALGPIVMDRIVVKLMPLLGGAQTAGFLEAAEQSVDLVPFLLQSDSLSFPIDGDVANLDADLKVDLGRLNWSGMPALAALGLAGTQAQIRLPAFTVPIRKGVARYDRLPIKIGGRELVLKGSVQLQSGEMSFATDIPLEMLGKKFNAELERVRSFLPPDTAVPIEIHGTWRKPRLALGGKFLEKALEKAAGKGVGDLLDGLLGGKKKKDG